MAPSAGPSTASPPSCRRPAAAASCGRSSRHRGTGLFSTAIHRKGTQVKRAPLRRSWYAVPGRQHKLRQPVVSVGNLSMGGRGKTPLVSYIARLLLDAGERPAILSRGYGRRRVEDGVVVVSDGHHILADVDRSGDEPLMLARAVPGAGVFVCDQRVLAGALAERRFGATVHVLDDGFQHLTLSRDVDVVVVSPEDLRDRAVPFGRLREPVSALASADAVLLDGDGLPNVGRPFRAGGLAGLKPRPTFDLPASVRQFSLRRSLGTVRALEPDRPWPQDAALRLGSGQGPVVAAAGIARPERFAAALRDAGWQVAREVAFADHHRYTAVDVARLASDVTATGAIGVVTTEKDAGRLLPWRPFPVRIATVSLEISVTPGGFGDQSALLHPADHFRTWLLDRLREARA
ncbi:MAG TPA: tetraacyldisaccharide 4'-kinase [Vicinamibacterales bacterium]|nr:tetraacyldisaccharide 4'-kinase [Vicinamibacterales bacterium]